MSDRARHVRVKICGITRPEDARAAEAAGADAIGLVFATSKRRVDSAAAAEIVAAVGPLLSVVGVFRNAPLEELLEVVTELDLPVVQLHGDEDEEYARAVARQAKVIRAVSYRQAPDPAGLAAYPAAAFLVDGSEPGSGRTYEREAIAGWRGHPRLIVAGGLTPENVAALVRDLRPYGVDTSTGVESAPGIKNHDAVYRFVSNARAAPLEEPRSGP